MVPQLKESINVGIVGLGLIGGSLSLDLQKLGHTVYGLTNRLTTAKKAKELGLGKVISTDPRILKNCSIVIIALPMKELLHPSPELINAIPKNAVVTDVGSVKLPVLTIWKQLHPRFVASHPMAGNNNSGVEAGQKNLFKNKPWVVTPDLQTDQAALGVVHQMALSLGSQWITTEAELHDQAVALISHTPVFISAALISTIQNTNNHQVLKLSKDLASSGFIDTTRIGGGNAQLGVAMAKNNKNNILKILKSYKQSIGNLEEIIISENWSNLEKELESTKVTRSEFTNNLLSEGSDT